MISRSGGPDGLVYESLAHPADSSLNFDFVALPPFASAPCAASATRARGASRPRVHEVARTVIMRARRGFAPRAGRDDTEWSVAA